MSITVPLYGFGGGGGTALNFKVVGNPQPASPNENTIWVDTDVPITGYYFSAEQPENMADGEVWISTGTESKVKFNALKKNAVQVYPLSAKQYVDGALVDVTAKSYQNGKWGEWFSGVYLYSNGNEYTDVTGGFSAIGTGTLTKGNSSLSFLCGQNNGFTAFATAEKVKRGSTKKLIVNIVTNPDAVRIGVSTTRTNTRANWATVFSVENKETGQYEIPLDDNSPNEFYVCIGGGTGKGTYTFEINEIKLSN